MFWRRRRPPAERGAAWHGVFTAWCSDPGKDIACPDCAEGALAVEVWCEGRVVQCITFKCLGCQAGAHFDTGWPWPWGRWETPPGAPGATTSTTND